MLVLNRRRRRRVAQKFNSPRQKRTPAAARRQSRDATVGLRTTACDARSGRHVHRAHPASYGTAPICRCPQYPASTHPAPQGRLPGEARPRDAPGPPWIAAPGAAPQPCQAEGRTYIFRSRAMAVARPHQGTPTGLQFRGNDKTAAIHRKVWRELSPRQMYVADASDLGSGPMRKILAALGMLVLLTNASSAQFYCEQVMQAIAIYGYEAARQYAMTHYGREAVEAGDRCVRERYPQLRTPVRPNSRY